MSIRILRSLIAAALLSAGLAQAAVKVGNVEFAPQQTVQQRTLELNGAGLRTRLGFKVYAMGLYLRAPLAEAGAILADKGEKRIRIVPIRDLEAKQFGDMLKTLPVQQRSTAIAAMTQTLGPQASAGLAQQLQPAKEDAAPQDRALGLAFGYATAKTTYGRYTSELILKGQQALADKTVKIEKGAEFGWQAEIAKQAYREGWRVVRVEIREVK